MNIDARERLACISTVTGSMLKQGLSNCFFLDAQALHPDDSQFIGDANTSSLNPISEDLSNVEVFGNPDYPTQKAVAFIKRPELLRYPNLRLEQKAYFLQFPDLAHE